MSAPLTAPSPDPECPLTAIAQPLSSLVSSQGNVLNTDKFRVLVKQALQLFYAGTDGHRFTPGRTFKLEHDSVVQASKALPAKAASTRLSRCAWHARTSVHDPAKDSHRLGYDDFYEGLAVDHPIKERQYIHDILRYERVGQPIDTAAAAAATIASDLIHAVRADVWVTEYKLPIVTANRDFVQLFLTVEFAPHSNPLSKEHVDALIAALDGKTDAASQTEASASGRRSCVNIQLPVSTSDLGPQDGFVRAFYGSVEGLRELENDKTEWWMAVQSDSSGHVPLMFQEMAMPSKVAPDVPAFIGWAVEQKSKGDSVQRRP